ncbi:MAG: GGDEF domain-containing protein [Alcaligenaceae bacterium]|nr:MAG: GGDEF domain-containing protein [Alcaligenaceae bacterium]
MRMQPTCRFAPCLLTWTISKQVNDTGGHLAGDALLRGVAHTLSAQVRQADSVARLGGDEFAVLLCGCPLPRAMVIAENMRVAVEAYRLHSEGSSFSVGASIGLVAVYGSFKDAAAVLSAADAACYAAKARGRNSVAVFFEKEARKESAFSITEQRTADVALGQLGS